MDLKAGPTLHEIAVAQARVRLVQAQSNVLRTQIEQYVLRSPLEGVVLLENPHRLLKPGMPADATFVRSENERPARVGMARTAP